MSGRDFLISSKEHQTISVPLANAQILALVVMSISPPKPRVESSNLSAPAKKTPEIIRFQAFFISSGTVRGLTFSPRRRAKHQIVHCVPSFCNRFVWYSIKRASGESGGTAQQTRSSFFEKTYPFTLNLYILKSVFLIVLLRFCFQGIL